MRREIVLWGLAVALIAIGSIRVIAEQSNADTTKPHRISFRSVKVGDENHVQITVNDIVLIVPRATVVKDQEEGIDVRTVGDQIQMTQDNTSFTAGETISALDGSVLGRKVSTPDIGGLLMQRLLNSKRKATPKTKDGAGSPGELILQSRGESPK